MAYLRSRLIPVAIVSVVGGIVFALPPFLGVHTVPIPKGPEGTLDVADLASVLDHAVRTDGVDYDALRAHRDPLLRFVQGLARIGPKATPDRFATRPERLAYHLNAYNALVLYGVVVHQPATSVQDVHGVLEPRPGFGFFWAQRFHLDGDRTNLYDLENDTIRAYGDARVHAAINCASRSCPPLRSEPFRAERLDAQLEAATRDWLGQPSSFDVEPDAIVLSEIFAWFADDFEAHARALEAGDRVIDWIAFYLPEARRASLIAAVERGATIRYRPYDWRLNRSEAQSTH